MQSSNYLVQLSDKLSSVIKYTGLHMDVNVPGLVSIIVFYLAILGVGLWAAWRRRGQGGTADEVMLAGRDIGAFVGVLTMTATWVGGGYINGSAEVVFTDGLIWCQAPIGYGLSLSIGGFFFARRMRDAGYVTMLDPLQEVFGRRWGAMLYLPALAGEMLWSAAVLGALGSTLTVILGLSDEVSIIVSAAIAVVYTLFGGLYSVAYTDVVQLFCIFIGLWLAIPFAWTNEAVGSLAQKDTDWFGNIPLGDPTWGLWADLMILHIFGGLPWQVYFQRVLSSRTSKQAEMLSYVASFGCIFMAVPAIMIGAIAKGTDWENTDYGKNITSEDAKLVLPLVMQYLTPTAVSFIGLGAVSAAVMSSADSSVLSASSMFAKNVYKDVFRQNASEKEIIWVMRGAVIVVASAASLISITSNSIYDLFALCGDFVYVMLFPQLTLAVHYPDYVNSYGSIVAYFLGLTLRLLGGEEVLGIPIVIEFPWCIDGVQNFPFRTLSMLVTLVTLLLVSWLTKQVFTLGLLPKSCDFMGITHSKEDLVPIKATTECKDNLGLEMDNTNAAFE
ncbi:unnamed protein product, partial [Meganyctiphanes norvegica]